MGSPLATAAFGLASAASWGAGDFSGGLATRRSQVLPVVVVSQGVGLATVVLLSLARGEPTPSLAALGWGSASGIFGAMGLLALYRALAVGRMGIAAPVTAVLAAALPVLFAAAAEGLPTMLQFAGFGLALVGVWLVSRPDGPMGRPEGLGLALLAGLGFGGFYILIDQARAPAVFWPLASAKATSLLFVLAIAGVGGSARRSAAGPAGWLAPALLSLIVLAGVLDAGGNAFFVLAEHTGRLDVSSVLASLYPATTVLLARLVLNERVSRTQAVGIAAALVAIPLIAA